MKNNFYYRLHKECRNEFEWHVGNVLDFTDEYNDFFDFSLNFKFKNYDESLYPNVISEYLLLLRELALEEVRKEVDDTLMNDKLVYNTLLDRYNLNVCECLFIPL